ncbi:MAG: GNAT family N-acetyltransferase [Acidimicrobiales bacterium]
MHDGGVQLRQVRLSDSEVASLLGGLAEEYERRYGTGDELASVDDREFEPPHGVFMVLIDDGEVVSGGGLRRLSDLTCEIKRVWTAPDRRQKGLASIILSSLEHEAKARGYRTLRLETGPAQPEARNLYERRGYRRIPPYGRYEHATAYELRLDVPSSPT